MNEQVAQNISTEIAVSIENMNKWYGTFHVLRDIDLTVSIPGPQDRLRRRQTELTGDGAGIFFRGDLTDW